MTRRTSPRTSRKLVLAFLSSVALIGSIIAAAMHLLGLRLSAIPMLAICVGGGVLVVVLFVVYRALTRPPEFPRIEPSFETSILAFPPESRLEPRGRRG